MKQFIATMAIGTLILVAVVMIVGPTAGQGTIAYKAAMTLYTGVSQFN